MAHSGNCESFGRDGFRGHIRAVRLEKKPGSGKAH